MRLVCVTVDVCKPVWWTGGRALDGSLRTIKFYHYLERKGDLRRVISLSKPQLTHLYMGEKQRQISKLSPSLTYKL